MGPHNTELDTKPTRFIQHTPISFKAWFTEFKPSFSLFKRQNFSSVQKLLDYKIWLTKRWIKLIKLRMRKVASKNLS